MLLLYFNSEKMIVQRKRLEWLYGGPPNACNSCCSCSSFITYSFARPLLDRGRTLANQARDNMTNTALNADDFPSVLFPTKHYQARLQSNWEKEKSTSPLNPKFWKAVIRTNAWWHCIFVAMAGGGRIFGALFLGYFVQQLESVTGGELGFTVLYGCMVLVGTLITSVGHHTFYYFVWTEALRMRVATVGLIYDKTTRLSLTALGRATSGRVFNMAAGDTMRIQFGLMFVPYFVWAPIEAVIILGLLIWEIGWAATIGWFFFVLCFVPLQLVFSRWFAILQFKAAKAADHRIKLTGEVATGAACVKSHCWEEAFIDLVNKARHKEVSILTKIAALRGMNEGIFFSSTTVVGTLIFLVHTFVANEPLSSKSVMVCLQLLLILQLTCAKFLCMGIMGYSQAFISMGRIGKFLMREEVQKQQEQESLLHVAEEQLKVVVPRGDKVVIEFTAASASWDTEETSKEIIHVNDGGDDGTIDSKAGDDNSKYNTAADAATRSVLSGLNFKIKEGQLVMVVGPVGCGKTSLLMTLLSELPISTGSMYVSPDLVSSSSFVSQTPYIQSGSVSENILFGKERNDAHFRRVVKSCALDKDIQALSNGERTLVGEKGVTLSGGQRARVALARACYAQAKFVLLDDPLSAVDPHVASALMENVITASITKGGLGDATSPNTVILCTHQVQFAPKADLLIVLGSNGTVIATGTYEELKNHPALYRDENNVEEKKDVEVKGDIEVEKKEITESEDATKMSGMSGISGVDVEVVADNDENESVEALRQRSTSSTCSTKRALSTTGRTGTSKQEEKDRSEVAEQRQTGVVQWATYAGYMSAGGGWQMFLPLSFCMASGQGVRMFAAWVMTVLAKKSVQRSLSNSNSTYQFAVVAVVVNNSTSRSDMAVPLSELNYEETATLLIVFAFVTLVIALIRSVWFFVALVRSAKTLHGQMIRSVVRAPMKFYDTNPTGRVLNRFSSDLAFADDQMPQSAFDFIGIGFQVLGMVAMAAVANPFVLIVLLPLIYSFLKLRAFYMDTSREIKRVEAMSRSPVFSQLSETLAGLVTIRGFKGDFKSNTTNTQNSTSAVVDRFRTLFNERLDENMSHFFGFIVTARWFGFRLDFINHGFTFSCVAIVLFLRFVVPELGATIIDANLVGLSILYMMQGGDAFQWCVRQAAEVENMMVSIERIREYIALPSEADLTSTPAIKRQLTEKQWPSNSNNNTNTGSGTGLLELKNVCMRYSVNGPNVLNNVSLSIKSGEKVALVGRTGAGKSSLLSALFRLTEPTSGVISIDGVDLKTLGLHDARGAFSIIPQTPWLFSGSIRKNIDPFGVHEDDILWKALGSCQLSTVFQSLDHVLTEAGNNLSTGEKQLVCLARALLSKPSKNFCLLEFFDSLLVIFFRLTIINCF